MWLCGKKLSNLPLPIHISISNEHRARPRRSAPLVEHLPNVISYNYDDTAFAENGHDWTDPSHPACAIGKKFSELNIKPNVPFRLECNRWLESGRRLEDWLPDLPTTHHFDFHPCGPPTFEIQTPCVVLHLAGWPDVPDSVWLAACDAFRGLGHVYIVGGSYDHRPRRLYQVARRSSAGVTLVEDTAWENIIGLLKSCDYCFGHASGFTAVADVLRCRGAVFNPRSVPRLINTWNSLENKGFIQVDDVRDFETALGAAYQSMETGNRSTWPLSAVRGPRISAAVKLSNLGDGPAGAARAAGMMGPKNILVWSSQDPPPSEVPSAIMDGVYTAGKYIRNLYLVGFDENGLAAAYKQSMRSTRKPSIQVSPYWEGPPNHETYDLAMLCVADRVAEAVDQVRKAWSVLSPAGTVLVGGAAAGPAVESLAATLRTKPVEVENAPGWFYLHRRM